MSTPMNTFTALCARFNAYKYLCRTLLRDTNTSTRSVLCTTQPQTFVPCSYKPFIRFSCSERKQPKSYIQQKSFHLAKKMQNTRQTCNFRI